MAKKVPHEDHVNHERYMVTYADLITLLLAFFIILYAMSEENEEKFDALAQSLSIAFNQGNPALVSTTLGTNVEVRKQQNQEAEMKMMESVKEQNELRELKQKIDEKIKEMSLENKISTQLRVEGLKIVLTDEVLFESGQAQLKEKHLDVVKTIATLIEGVQNPVEVSGFTDNMPISTNEFPSNWELSSARSMSVLRYLLETNKTLNPTRFSSAGFGEYQPIASNDTSEGRGKNRRVEILVERLHADGLLEVK